MFSSWDSRPRTYEARDVLDDIEKILNFLDGNMTRNVNLSNTLEIAFRNGITKNIELKYFRATFYKKGTVHLTFTCPELIERFNIYAARNKNWLPPSYGTKRYNDMDEAERTVIDSFQGEAAYAKVMKNAEYYLSSPVGTKMLMLSA